MRTGQHSDPGLRPLLLVAALVVLAMLCKTLPGLVGDRHPPASIPARIDMRSLPINQATAAQIETLPGLGPALAARVVEERARGGAFSSIGDLERVKGIGPVKARAVEPYLLF